MMHDLCAVLARLAIVVGAALWLAGLFQWLARHARLQARSLAQWASVTGVGALMLAIYGWSEDRHACQGVLVSAVAGSEFMLGFVTSLAIESRLSAAEPKIRVEMDSAWLVRLNSPIDHVVGVLSGAAVGFCPGMLYLIGFKRTKTPWEVVVVVTCFVWIGVVVTYYFWLATHVRARLKAAVVAKNRSEPIKSPQSSDDAAVVVVAKYSSDDFKPPESSDDAAHRPDEKR